MNTLSIIIVTYNSAGTIGQCLRTVVQSIGTLVKSEIIVVDNNSFDATVTIIEKSYPTVGLIKNRENLGFAVAANQGAKRAAGDLLFFLNPDTEVPHDFMGTFLRAIAEYADCGIMGFQFIDFDRRPLASSWRLPKLWTICIESCLPFSWSQALVTVSASSPSPVEMISGGCMMIRSDTFRSLHGFDEKYFLYYEDADICLRASRSGYTVMLFPALRIVHRGRGSFNNDYSEFFPLYYLGKLLYCSKHFSNVPYRVSRAMIFSGILLRIAAYRITGLFPGKSGMRELAKNHREAYRRLKTFDLGKESRIFLPNPPQAD